MVEISLGQGHVELRDIIPKQNEKVVAIVADLFIAAVFWVYGNLSPPADIESHV